MRCVNCKKNDGKPKFCSVGCQKEAGKRFDRIIGNLKREKRPWGDVIRGKGDDEVV